MIISGVLLTIHIFFFISSRRVGLIVPTRENLTELYILLQNQVLLGSIIGEQGFQYIQSLPIIMKTSIIYILTVFTVLVGYIYMIKSDFNHKLLMMFGVTVFIISALVCTVGKTHHLLVLAQSFGIRFWLIPSFSLLVSVFYICWKQGIQVIYKMIAATLIITGLVFQLLNMRDFRYTSLSDLHWTDEINTFEKQNSGVTYTIPINPDGWAVTLIKK